MILSFGGPYMLRVVTEYARETGEARPPSKYLADKTDKVLITPF